MTVPIEDLLGPDSGPCLDKVTAVLINRAKDRDPDFDKPTIGVANY